MKEQTNELKPCPFCGSTRVIVDTTILGAYTAECLDCCAIISHCYPTKEDAIAAWNRRAEKALVAQDEAKNIAKKLLAYINGTEVQP